jgi:hypothetical protein
MSGFNYSQCPRCGPIQSYADESYFRCNKCHQFLDLPLGDASRVVWKSIEGDNSFALPYRYRRCLERVPGVPYPVATGLRINQDVVEFIRKNFVPRDSDIWVTTYPKAGTTWIQNIVSHIVYEEPNAPQGGVAVGLTSDENIMWFEAQCVPPVHIKDTLHCLENEDFDCTEFATETLNRVNASPKRRAFKSHSPLGILEPLLTAKGKVIHVARNPKDVAVSMWHHSRTKLFAYEGTFEHFVDKLFIPGELESGSWWDFVIPYIYATRRCECVDDPCHTSECSKVMTVWYEHALESPVETVMRIANFVDVPISADRAREIADACSFGNMKAAEENVGLLYANSVLKRSEQTTSGTHEEPSARQVRVGGCGGWANYFSDELSTLLDSHHESEMRRYGVTEGRFLSQAEELLQDRASGTSKAPIVLPIQWGV